MSNNRRLVISGLVLGVGLGTLHGLGAFEVLQQRLEQGEPKATDTTVPTVILPANEIVEPLRGLLVVPIIVEDEGENLAHISVQLDDGESQSLPASGATWELDTQHIPDGTHTVRVYAVDEAENSSSAHLVFTSDNTPPRIELSEQSVHVAQGQSLALLLRSDASDLSVDFLDKERHLHPVPGVENTWRAMVGVPIPTEARDHPLHITASDPAGNRVFSTFDVEVEAYKFERGGYIRLSAAQTSARKDREAIDKANEDRMSAYAVRSEAQMWAGSMRLPVEGRRTSEFGRYRSYSDGARKHHYGTDFGAVTGTPVESAAAGTVTLAEWQTIYGNVVIVDHGHGVSTSYNHMNSIAVQKGDSVELGTVLGEVGSTGQSTGPHLHWGLTVDGVSVNAEQWLEGDFLPKADDEWFELETAPIETWIPEPAEDAP